MVKGVDSSQKLGRVNECEPYCLHPVVSVLFLRNWELKGLRCTNKQLLTNSKHKEFSIISTYSTNRIGSVQG